jgi:hypothetical protein
VLNIVLDAEVNITIGFVQTLDIRLNQVAIFALVGLFPMIGARRLHVSDFISYTPVTASATSLSPTQSFESFPIQSFEV